MIEEIKEYVWMSVRVEKKRAEVEGLPATLYGVLHAEKASCTKSKNKLTLAKP